MTRRLFALPFLAITFAGYAGCDGCDEVINPIDEDNGLPIGDLEPRVLAYVGEEPYRLYQNESGELRFTWKTVSGFPVAGDTLQVSVAGDAALITQGGYITDVGGGIGVGVDATSNEGNVTVKVQGTDVDGAVKEVVVNVRVEENPAANLVVTVESNARIPVETANVKVFAGSNPVPCPSLLAGANQPLAQANAQFPAVPATQTFANMPTGSIAVVYAEGVTSDGVVVARGCNSVPSLVGGVDNRVTVELEQDATKLEGDYDVLMHMYLGDALPSPYDETVDLVSALIADPAGYAMFIVLREVDRQTGFTTFVTRDGVEMRYRDLEANPGNFPTWSWARDELDQVLANTLGQTYVDVTNVGAGIRDVVSDFEVGGRFTVTEGDNGALTIDESWRDLVLYWPLPCDDGDLACARRPLSLEDANLSPVVTTYGALAAYDPVADQLERYSVATDPHGLNIRYGAFLVAILEQVVFPSLPGAEEGDDIGDFLTNIVGCDSISQALTDDPNLQSFVEGICAFALDFAGQEIENRLLALQIDATNPALGEEGLSSGGTFALLDDDQDLVAELVSDYSYDIYWYDPNDPAQTEDISSPITGDGLRDRLDCTDDQQCSSGFVCTPKGSYLKVARLDLGCSRAKGELAGGAACSGDSQCASGLCAPVGAAGALQCFDACDGINDCSAGQVCSATGGLIDLDGVLAGLGDIAAPGCTAP